jgi:hypothetical protein
MPNFKVFSGTSHPDLVRRICERLGIPMGKTIITRFSNQELWYVVEWLFTVLNSLEKAARCMVLHLLTCAETGTFGAWCE